jgi:hypothetical protein
MKPFPEIDNFPDVGHLAKIREDFALQRKLSGIVVKIVPVNLKRTTATGVVSEMLEFVPGRFKVIRTVRPKLACNRCDGIVQEPAPRIKGGRRGTGPRVSSNDRLCQP